MPQRKSKGIVFISYAHDDRARVEPLVKILARRFNVFWDKEITPGSSWRQFLMNQLDEARCVVVIWTTNSVNREFVWQELERVKERGIVVPVLLDTNVKVPLGFNGWQYIDLTNWGGKGERQLNALLKIVANLIARPSRQRRVYYSLSSDDYTVRQSIYATGALQDLGQKVKRLEGLLIKENGPVKDLLGSLREIHKTYKSVSLAIDLFLSPIGKKGNIKTKPYLDMERGKIISLIDNNRGHCKRILEYYGREGGIRDWLVRQDLPADKLKELDDIFGQLGTADGDLFAELSRIGDVMTEESSAIVGLLVSNQQNVAKTRLLAGRKKLLPLEKKLSKAMSVLQHNLSSIGYVPPKLKNKIAAFK